VNHRITNFLKIWLNNIFNKGKTTVPWSIVKFHETFETIDQFKVKDVYLSTVWYQKLLCRRNNWDIKEIFFFLCGDSSPSALALHCLGCGVRWSRGHVEKDAWVEENRDVDPLCCWIVELVFSGSTETGLHSSILPQTLYHSSQLCCHETLLSTPRQHKQLPRVILRHRERTADLN